MHAMAKVNSADIGRILISATYFEPSLRLEAIRAGAVDCIFVEEGIEQFVKNVEMCKEPEADFGIRSLLPELTSGVVNEEEFAAANIAIDTLDAKEQSILESFCALKTDAQIAQIAQVPKLKVRQTIKKVENLLLLNTRSQLLLRLHELEALTL
jgi:DNA-binding NarL/FixJ family response regulator